MRILSMDTSQKTGGVAVLEGNILLGELIFNIDKTYSMSLFPAIKMLLRHLELDFPLLDGLVVGLGPGSFTGLRIGVASAKAIAFSLSIPVVGVSSLDAMAIGARSMEGTTLCPLIDARKGQVFTAFYETEDNGKIRRVSPYLAIKPRALLERLPERKRCVLFGDGLERYKDILGQAKKRAILLDAQDPSFSLRPSLLGLIGIELFCKRPSGDSFHQLEPIYIRPSDAEIKRFKIDEGVFQSG